MPDYLDALPLVGRRIFFINKNTMPKMRYINTKFWDDEYIVSLTPSEKLLYLYLLTNPAVEISGVYEITPRRISFDTGIEESFLKTMLDKFEADKRLLYRDNWMVILNFIKNQAINPNVEKGIARSLVNTPKWVRDAIAFQRLQKPSEESRTELNLTELNLTELKPDNTDPAKAGINQVFKIFYDFNKTFNYGNKAQRTATLTLIKKLGLETVVNAATYALKIQSEKYAPTITTPLQLLNKYGELQAYYAKHEIKKGMNVIKL